MITQKAVKLYSFLGDKGAMKVKSPYFKVEMPEKEISRRMILNPHDIRRRQALVEELNRRKINARSAFELERQGLIIYAHDVIGQKQVLPENIPYERVFGKTNLSRPQKAKNDTAAEYFLYGIRNRTVSSEMIKKYPLLAATMEHALSMENDKEFNIAEILARVDAPELVLCAAISMYDGRAGVWEQFWRSVVEAGVRLGIERRFLVDRSIQTVRLIKNAFRAVGLRFNVLSGPHGSIVDIKLKSEETVFSFALNDQQLLGWLNMQRSILSDRESKMLYSALSINNLAEYAEAIYWDYRSGKAKACRSENARKIESLRLSYWLQVLPIIEELEIPQLIDQAKESYFKSFHPDRYYQVEQLLARHILFGHQGLIENDRFEEKEAQKHVGNMVRLIGEIIAKTKLVPTSSKVEGRMKTHFSLYESITADSKLAEKDYPLDNYDIFAFRILVTDQRSVGKAVQLLKQAFLSVPEAAAELMDKYKEENIVPGCQTHDRWRTLRRYLSNVQQFLRSEDAVRKGLIGGERDAINSGKGRVPYHTLVLTTYRSFPMEMQITTFDLENKIRADRQHWKYKLLKQLRISGLGGALGFDDLKVSDKSKYVALIDERTKTMRIKRLPSGTKLADLPKNLKAFPAEELLGNYLYDTTPLHRPHCLVDNGYVLFRDQKAKKK